MALKIITRTVTVGVHDSSRVYGSTTPKYAESFFSKKEIMLHCLHLFNLPILHRRTMYKVDRGKMKFSSMF